MATDNDAEKIARDIELLVSVVRRGLMNLHYAKGGNPCVKCGLEIGHPIHLTGKEYAGSVRNEASRALDALQLLQDNSK